jgi:hypothetical protein
MPEETQEQRTVRLGKLLIEYTKKSNNVPKAIRTLEKIKQVGLIFGSCA